jgi:hypothetical protein
MRGQFFLLKKNKEQSPEGDFMAIYFLQHIDDCNKVIICDLPYLLRNSDSIKSYSITPIQPLKDGYEWLVLDGLHKGKVLMYGLPEHCRGGLQLTHRLTDFNYHII